MDLQFRPCCSKVNRLSTKELHREQLYGNKCETNGFSGKTRIPKTDLRMGNRTRPRTMTRGRSVTNLYLKPATCTRSAKSRPSHGSVPPSPSYSGDQTLPKTVRTYPSFLPFLCRGTHGRRQRSRSTCCHSKQAEGTATTGHARPSPPLLGPAARHRPPDSPLTPPRGAALG